MTLVRISPDNRLSKSVQELSKESASGGIMRIGSEGDSSK